jgi:methionyl-tRNA formyltransferase
LQTGKDNPVLRKKSKPVTFTHRKGGKIDEEILKLIKDMDETMIKNNGMGLAACQIGRDIQLFVIDKNYSDKCVFINPETIKFSKKTELIEEGCLSLPELFIPVKRAKSLKIKAIDENGKKFKIKAKDMLARAIQHEMDHINGILITDKNSQVSMTNNQKIRTILMGTPEFAERIFRKALPELISKGLEIIAVVTAPDKPVGRKQVLASSPVKKWALEANFSVLEPDKIRKPEWVAKIKELNPDLIILTAFGQIIPQEILDIPKFKALNIHPSLLPKYRGASPIQSAILNDETETGVCLIIMDQELDHGPIISNYQCPIPNKITYKELSDELADVGAELLIKTLPDWIDGKIKPQEQDHSQATFCKLIKKEDGKIDWNKSAEEIERQIRAYSQWPGSYAQIPSTKKQDTILKVLEANSKNGNTNNEIGKVLLNESKDLCVQTGDGILISKTLQLEGKKPVSAKDFLNGHKEIIGTILQ